MRNTLIALAAALGLTILAPLPAVAGDDNGGTPIGPCVSHREWRKAHYGQTPRRVARLFGTAGWRSNYETNRTGSQEHRQYKACDGKANYIVQFTNYNRDSVGWHLTKKMR